MIKLNQNTAKIKLYHTQKDQDNRMIKRVIHETDAYALLKESVRENEGGIETNSEIDVRFAWDKPQNIHAGDRIDINGNPHTVKAVSYVSAELYGEKTNLIKLICS